MCTKTDFTELDYINVLYGAVKDELTEKRLSHVVSVAKTAYRICCELKFSESDTKKTVTAAFLHDITKEKTTEEHMALCQKYGIELTENELRSPSVLHQITGAPYAKEKLPLMVDDDVCGMISKHCTGGGGMTLCEKIVFLSDYIEPERRHEACKTLNDFYFNKRNGENIEKHLDKAVLLAYDNTVRNLKNKGAFIHPLTFIGFEEQKQTVDRKVI